MTYAAVGAFLVPTVSTTATTFTFSLTPAAIGNLIVFGVEVGASTIAFGSFSSANATWFPLIVQGTNATLNKRVALIAGVATATSAQTVTGVLSGGTAASAGAAGHEFSTSLGTKALWHIGPSGVTTQSASTTLGGPSLLPDCAGELRFDYVFVTNTGTGTNGTPAGYVYNTDSAGNMQDYNLSSVATATASIGTQTSGASEGVGAMFRAEPLWTPDHVGAYGSYY